MTLDRMTILEFNDRQIECVPIPEWGGEVFVRNMTAGERDRWEIAAQGKRTEDVRAALAVLTVCDESGELLFKQEDIPLLTAKNAAPMQRIFNASIELNRISETDIKELEKN